MKVLERAKPMLKRSRLLKLIYHKLHLRWAIMRLKGPRLLRKMASLHPDAFFIQVGANDGDQLDPLRKIIHRKPWRGIMVEPVPYVFEKLRKNNDAIANRVVLENVAISNESGKLPFWHLRQAAPGECLPRMYDAIGSFHREVVVKHVDFIPDIEKRLICTDVPTITFRELCQRNNVRTLDVLQIDTEGHDYEVIKLIDFEVLAPTLIIYEHHHFDASTERECQSFLCQRGYEFFKEGMDTWCLRTSVKEDSNNRKLIDYWSKLTAR